MAQLSHASSDEVLTMLLCMRVSVYEQNISKSNKPINVILVGVCLPSSLIKGRDLILRKSPG